MSWSRNPKDSLDGIRIVCQLSELLAGDNRRVGNLERARFHEARIEQYRGFMQAMADMYRRLSRLLP